MPNAKTRSSGSSLPDDTAAAASQPESQPEEIDTPAHTVAIYVSDHCVNCEYAREIAALIHTEYPDIHLKVIDLAAPGEAIPDIVFATPTYLLNGRVWSLGNPSTRQVRDTLDQLEGKN